MAEAMTMHYDPIQNDDIDTVSDFAEQYDAEASADDTLFDAQAELAAVLHAIGPQVMDDPSKHAAMKAIARAMLIIDAQSGHDTEIQREVIEEDDLGSETVQQTVDEVYVSREH